MSIDATPFVAIVTAMLAQSMQPTTRSPKSVVG